jgi:hypothetical protein
VYSCRNALQEINKYHILHPTDKTISPLLLPEVVYVQFLERKSKLIDCTSIGIYNLKFLWYYFYWSTYCEVTPESRNSGVS